MLTCGVCKREADAIVERKSMKICNMLNVCRRAFDVIAIIRIDQARYSSLGSMWLGSLYGLSHRKRMLSDVSFGLVVNDVLRVDSLRK